VSLNQQKNVPFSMKRRMRIVDYEVLDGGVRESYQQLGG
jgi:hypothetical protein